MSRKGFMILLSNVCVSVAFLAACKGVGVTPDKTILIPTITPAYKPTLTGQATKAPDPVETDTPKSQAENSNDFATPVAELPKDMPQEFQDKLAEWDYTVSGDGNTVSVDGEAWFQKVEKVNEETGTTTSEWEKVYYEKDGLRWTPSDLFGGRIIINPEKAGEIHDKLVEFLKSTNKFAGTENGILRPEVNPNIDVMWVEMEDTSTTIDYSTVTLELPMKSEGPKITLDNGEVIPLQSFVTNGEYAPFTKASENSHGAIKETLEDKHPVLSIYSFSTVDSQNRLALLDSDSAEENAVAASQLINFLFVNILAKQIQDRTFLYTSERTSKRQREDGTYVICLRVGDELDYYEVVSNDANAYSILRDPSLLDSDTNLFNSNQRAITIEELKRVLVQDSFLPRHQ